MTKIIRPILFVTIALALTACGVLNQRTAEANSLAVDLPALGLSIQIQNATDVFNTVGQIINYNYTVTYTDTAALAGPVIVTDTPATVVTCPNVSTVGNLDASLNQNETIICKSTYAITQADINAGSVTKNAIASIGGISSAQASVAATLTQNKAITLTKSASPLTFTQLGQVITYTYSIKNTGSVAIGPTQFTVTDNRIPTPILCGANNVTLLPTETVSCTATYTIVQADLTTGSVTNSATASGGGAGPSQPATVTVTNPNVVTTNPNPSSASLTAGATIQHKVVAGEWLIQIARCYGASFTDVRNANLHVADPNVISIDTIVTVPRIGSVGKIYGPPCVGTHTVQTGDTWSSIAQKYNADTLVLQAANPSSLLSVGSIVKVPLNSFNSSSGIINTPVATPTPTLTPTPTATSTEPIRITFAQGTTSTTLNGTLNSLGTIRFLVNANQDQVMSASLVATPANEVAMSIYNPSGAILKPLDANLTWNGVLPATGDYRIEIISIGGASKAYSLLVSITTPLPTATPTP